MAQKIRWMIHQTLWLFSLIKNHTQERKLEDICALRGRKFGLKTIFGFWSDKRQNVWYFIRRIFYANSENKIFYPILQYCQSLWNLVHSINGGSENKTDVLFGFRMKNCISLQVIFRFLRPKFNFTVKLKIFYSKSQKKSTITPEPFVWSLWFFCKLLPISFPFQI